MVSGSGFSRLIAKRALSALDLVDRLGGVLIEDIFFLEQMLQNFSLQVFISVLGRRSRALVS